MISFSLKKWRRLSFLSIITFYSFSFHFANGTTRQLSSILGSWEVWIPGAILYVEKDQQVYQSHSKGAEMATLKINKDLSYTWGDSKGILELVKPWHAEVGKNYYRFKDKKGNTYDFWYKNAEDKLIILFGEVGGHAATGTRISGNIVKSNKYLTKTETDALVSNKSEKIIKPQQIDYKKDHKLSFKIGDKVHIQWKEQWYSGYILEQNKQGLIKVRYDNWGSAWDEWVTPNRLKKKD